MTRLRTARWVLVVASTAVFTAVGLLYLFGTH